MKDLRSYMEHLKRLDGDLGIDAMDSANKLRLRADELEAMLSRAVIGDTPIINTIDKAAQCFRHIVHLAAWFGYSPEELAALSLEDHSEDTYR